MFAFLQILQKWLHDTLDEANLSICCFMILQFIFNKFLKLSVIKYTPLLYFLNIRI